MTVKELRERLLQFPDDHIVYYVDMGEGMVEVCSVNVGGVIYQTPQGLLTPYENRPTKNKAVNGVYLS